MKRFLLLTLSLSVLACASEKDPVTGVDNKRSTAANADISAERLSDGIRLTNQGSKAIRYVAKNEGWLGLLAGCHNEPSSCASLAAGETVVIKAADIHGFDAQAPALEVWYWVAGDNDPAGRQVRLPLN